MSKHPSTDTGKEEEEEENNRTSTTYIRDGASFAVKCISIAPLKEKEGVKGREVERQKERAREKRTERWRVLRGLNLLHKSPTKCSTTHVLCTHT